MTVTRGAVVARAAACVGARFRPQGRDPAHGLDCVGLVAVAGGLTGVPARYAMRGGDADAIAALVDEAGLTRTARGRAGSVALVEAGPRQFHLAVLTDDGFIHADAGIGRVTAVPGALPWPVRAMWDFEGG